ncbi:MAG: polysaccharide deacetylase family protein [Turicibacter sp.]
MIKKIVLYTVILIMSSLIGLKIYHLYTLDQHEKYPVFPLIEENNVCLGLNYHRIRKPTLWNKALDVLTGSKELSTYNVYEDEFESQMKTLIEQGAYFATPNELITFQEIGLYPEKCVWISFDDIDETVYNNAFPIMKRNQIPFTVFVITGHVGDDNFNNFKLADWDELREMRDSGLTTFGSHTYDMHYLEDEQAIFLDPDQFDEFSKDIQLSKEMMEAKLEVPVAIIAYPFGETADEITKIVKQQGYKQAAILSPHPIEINNDQYYLNRYLIDPNVFKQVVIPWLSKMN